MTQLSSGNCTNAGQEGIIQHYYQVPILGCKLDFALIGQTFVAQIIESCLKSFKIGQTAVKKSAYCSPNTANAGGYFAEGANFSSLP